MEIKIDYQICKNCGRKSKTTSNKWVCNRCDTVHRPGDITETYVLEEEKVDTSIHSQYRVRCNACGKNSIVWAPKKTMIVECPSCNEKRRINVLKIAPNGVYSGYTVWENSSFVQPPVPRPNKYVTICPKCKHMHRFVIKKPSNCKNCGEEL